MRQISPQELSDWLSASADSRREPPLLLDVREPWEVALCALPGSVPVPMRAVPARIPEFDPERDVVVICHHGARSAQVAYFLERHGFSSVFNLLGGVDAWARTVDPAFPLY